MRCVGFWCSRCLAALRLVRFVLCFGLRRHVLSSSCPIVLSTSSLSVFAFRRLVDPAMQSAMSSFAATVVTSPPVVEAAISLSNALLANPSVIAASSSLAADVVATPPVLEATANALSVGAIDAVARPVVVDAAREMVVGLVAQEAVRTAAADAAWAVLKVGVFGSGRGARARRAAAATTPSEEEAKGHGGGEAAGKVSEVTPRGLSAAALNEKEQPGGSLVAAAVVT